MADRSSRRKLAAILSADVVGYSRLMAADEAATVETLKAYRDIITRLVMPPGGLGWGPTQQYVNEFRNFK